MLENLKIENLNLVMSSELINRIKTGLENLGLKFISVDEKIVFMFLQTSKNKVRPIVIMAITRPVVQKFVELLKKEGHYAKDGILHNGTIQGIPVTLVNADMGAPYAALMMETLHRTDAKLILRADVCGSLTPSIPMGHIVVPTETLSGEGTSPYYGRKYQIDATKSQIDANSLQIMKEVISSLDSQWQERVHFDSIWSTDALFCETPEEITIWKDKGAMAVDMETSIMYLLSQQFHLPTIAMLGVTDLPGSKDFDLFESNKLHPDMQAGMDRIVDLIKLIVPKLAEKLKLK